MERNLLTSLQVLWGLGVWNRHSINVWRRCQPIGQRNQREKNACKYPVMDGIIPNNPQELRSKGKSREKNPIVPIVLAKLS